jgi:phosphatidylserine/phosphatidylglycerophosphate/cardiolipin synthase-like enzyme
LEFLFPSFTPPLGGARASSHNWSTSAETRNDENTLIINDKIVTDQYFQAFAYLYNFAGGVLNATEFAQANHQEMLQQIMGWDYKAFSQVVVLSASNFRPFMQIFNPCQGKLLGTVGGFG